MVGHVDGVDRDTTSGAVAALVLRSGVRVEGDLFIDCTGFQSLLLGGAMEEPFLSDSDRLLCDAAVALPARHRSRENGLPPFTTSTAMNRGWSWDIPLHHRRGCGYVFSQSYWTRDEAESEIRSFLGPAAEGMDARHLCFRVGRHRRTWVKNVVALGLAAAFLEPLESTSIFLIEYGLANLTTFFPDAGLDEPRANEFNRVMNDVYEELRDFILLHYAVANRRDTPFWREATSTARHTDTLAERLQFIAESLPVHESRFFALFRGFSYMCILDGNGRTPARRHPLVDLLGTEAGDALLADLAMRNRECVDSMPSHAAGMDTIHGSPNGSPDQ